MSFSTNLTLKQRCHPLFSTPETCVFMLTLLFSQRLSFLPYSRESSFGQGSALGKSLLPCHMLLRLLFDPNSSLRRVTLTAKCGGGQIPALVQHKTFG